ncbi:MAG: 3-hydroxylacyl-ACP dehydratase [Burkholderiaceae bacterium]|nr:3-hydroxylacyl-ACP dehydratase [Burkholderiaceae bacterium]
MLNPPINIASLIPHQGAMCLLERVLEWDATRIRCSAISHRDPQHPLRTAAGLPAACGIEYAAQAVAVHGGLLAPQAGAPESAPIAGYLANARDVSWNVDRLDDLSGELAVEAEQLISEGGRSIYAFSLSHAGEIVMQGRVAVSLNFADQGTTAGGAA